MPSSTSTIRFDEYPGGDTWYQDVASQIRRSVDLSNYIAQFSIYKSGTNRMRHFLANYLLDRYLGNEDGVSFKATAECILPNLAERTHVVVHDPHPVFERTPYQGYIYGHVSDVTQILHPKRNIFIYRNPLDTLVSAYFYFEKCRNTESNRTIHDFIRTDNMLEYYGLAYNLMNEMARATGNCYLVSYEAMWLAPYWTYLPLLEWLGLSIDDAALRRAITHSSFQTVRQEEESSGPVHAPEGFRGYFTRSGRVGQWVQHLTDDDVAYVGKQLARHNIPLDRFVLLEEQHT